MTATTAHRRRPRAASPPSRPIRRVSRTCAVACGATSATTGEAPPASSCPNVPTNEEAGRRARDIGAYTIIPMMLLAGPAIGYLLGLGAERVLGGKPWPSLAGMLWGLAAAFRQVYLILKNRGEQSRRGN